MAKTVSNVWVTCLVSACLIVAYVPYLTKWQLEAMEPMTPPEYKYKLKFSDNDARVRRNSLN